jgi:hypothetical protein
MSGRDPNLKGFGLNVLKLSNNRNYFKNFNFNFFFHYIQILRIEEIEFYNSLILFNELDQIDKTNLTFLACVRLTVFWRRRRDVLSTTIPVVSHLLNGLGVTTPMLIEAEMEVLTATCCSIWRSDLNEFLIIFNILINFRNHQIIQEICLNLNSLFLFDPHRTRMPLELLDVSCLYVYKIFTPPACV